MIGRTVKSVINKPITGGVEWVPPVDVALDIVDALDIIEHVDNDEGSKDFTEKEISIDGLKILKKEKSVSEQKHLITTVSSKKLCDLKMVITTPERRLDNEKKCLKNIDANERNCKQKPGRKGELLGIKKDMQYAIERGKQRIEDSGLKQTYKLNMLPLQKPLALVEKEFKQELESLVPKRDNQRRAVKPGKLLFKTMVLYEGINRWMSGKVELDIGMSTLNLENKISMHKKSLAYRIQIIKLEKVQVEENDQIIWLFEKNLQNKKKAIETDIVEDNLKDIEENKSILGLSFLSISDCSTLLHWIGYLSKNSIFERCRISPNPNVLPPVLHSCLVKWNSSGTSATQMGFIGEFCYYLQTPRKETRSRVPALIYIKAGVIYIYDSSESDLLPTISLPLLWCALCNDEINMKLGKETRLIIYTGLGAGQRVLAVVNLQLENLNEYHAGFEERGNHLVQLSVSSKLLRCGSGVKERKYTGDYKNEKEDILERNILEGNILEGNILLSAEVKLETTTVERNIVLSRNSNPGLKVSDDYKTKEHKLFEKCDLISSSNTNEASEASRSGTMEIEISSVTKYGKSDSVQVKEESYPDNCPSYPRLLHSCPSLYWSVPLTFLHHIAVDRDRLVLQLAWSEDKLMVNTPLLVSPWGGVAVFRTADQMDKMVNTLINSDPSLKLIQINSRQSINSIIKV